ncbi:hypothetical protein A3I47_02300 [Candidatus Kaiserbacteria bacterium RIFCSPLOWO2_02_FULL_59_19]|nr:MAG: hypothetical protein A2766_03600 [Candidatus Kaiserbacteria bacterium RIFCSPHIGHO2_01_FULL_58_22]OGG84462.1 MAG: hypothetical protein A3I47_02300 [Candidatus Kaiserbacteria bacterium RIFCSPLOWO2_02_FULL_59_19]
MACRVDAAFQDRYLRDWIGRYVSDAASSEVAEVLLTSIHTAGECLALNPHLWRVRHEILLKEVRFAPAQPYLICYRVVGSTIQILHVIHQKRDIAVLFEEMEKWV